MSPAEKIRTDLRAKYEHSFYDFIWDVLGYHALEENLHGEVCDFLTNWKQADEVDYDKLFADLGMEPGEDGASVGNLTKFIKVLLLPREHLKSTIASISFPLWLWTLDPKLHDFPCGVNTRILLSHGKREQACDYAGEIKGHILKNERLQWIYPDVFPKEPKRNNIWLKDRFTIKRTEHAKTPNFYASGTKASVVGHHFDYFIADDLVFEENVGTPTLREQTQKYFQVSMALVRRGGRVIVPMTRWHNDDLASHLLDPKGPKRNVVDSMVKSSGYFEGKPIFPPSKEVPTCGFDMIRLQMKRESMSDREFFCQYENNPQLDASVSFREEDINRFHFQPDGTLPMENDLAYAMAVDMNRSTKTQNDPCAIMCAAIDAKGNIWVVDLYRGHPTGMELVETVYRMYKKWHPKVLCFETTAGQESWLFELRRLALADDVKLPIREMKRGPTTAKMDRITGMQPLVERKQLYVPIGGNFEILVSELVNLGVSKNDDCADTLADIYSVMGDVRPMKQKKVEERKPPPSQFLLNEILSGMNDGSNRVVRVLPKRGW